MELPPFGGQLINSSVSGVLIGCGDSTSSMGRNKPEWANSLFYKNFQRAPRPWPIGSASPLAFRTAISSLSRRSFVCGPSWERISRSAKARSDCSSSSMIACCGRSVSRFVAEAMMAWYKWLNRRSQRSSLTWDRYYRGLLRQYPLPRPRIVVSIWFT